MRRATQQVLQKTIEEKSRNSVKRQFLPLSVWEKQGYDIEVIQQRGRYFILFPFILKLFVLKHVRVEP